MQKGSTSGGNTTYLSTANSTYIVQDRGDIGMNAKGQIYAPPVKTSTKTTANLSSVQTTAQLAAQAAAMATENMINAASKKLTDQNRNNAQLQAAAMSTETMINDAARKVSAQLSKLVSQQSNISDAFTRATVAERMIQEVTDRQIGTQKALVAKTETAIQTQMQAKSSGVDLDMLRQMSSVGYKSLHGEAAADLFKANALLDHILDPSLTIAWKVTNGEEKPANEIRETIKLDQRYLFDHAKTTLATRIDQLDKGTAPKDVNWGMEAVVAGSMYKGINVEKRVETLYNLSVQKGQLTSVQQKELGDIYDLTSSNFIVHASTMGSMSMEKAEFQKGLERIAEGQTYLGYALINVAVGKMAQYNLDAGVGVSTWDDPANTRFKIESKGGVAAGDVAVGSMTDNATVAPSTVESVMPIESGGKLTSNVGKAYLNTPSVNHSTTTNNPGYKGVANSSIDILDNSGNIQTRRWFGSDGKAIRDIDMTNHGNPKTHSEWPHEHIWIYGSDGKPTGR